MEEFSFQTLKEFVSFRSAFDPGPSILSTILEAFGPSTPPIRSTFHTSPQLPQPKSSFYNLFKASFSTN